MASPDQVGGAVRRMAGGFPPGLLGPIGWWRRREHPTIAPAEGGGPPRAEPAGRLSEASWSVAEPAGAARTPLRKRLWAAGRRGGTVALWSAAARGGALAERTPRGERPTLRAISTIGPIHPPGPIGAIAALGAFSVSLPAPAWPGSAEPAAGRATATTVLLRVETTIGGGTHGRRVQGEGRTDLERGEISVADHHRGDRAAPGGQRSPQGDPAGRRAAADGTGTAIPASSQTRWRAHRWRHQRCGDPGRPGCAPGAPSRAHRR